MMQLRQFEAFRAVMVTGSMTAAADMLGVSQPAVSRLIASLEAHLSLPLFERRGRHLRPTTEAGYLVEQVNGVIEGIEQIEQAAAEIRDHASGHVRITCLPGFATTFMPRLIADFMRGHPKVTISFQPRSNERVQEAIIAQQFDVGISDAFRGHPAVDHETVHVPVVCVLPAAHRLAARSVIGARDLAGEPFIAINRDTAISAAVRQAFAEADADLNVRVELRQFASACIMVGEGLGVSIVSVLDAIEFAHHGLAMRRFEPDLSFGMSVLYPAHRRRLPLVTRFVERFKRGLEASAADWSQGRF